MQRPRPAMMVLIGSLVLLIGAPLAWAGFVASSDSVAVTSVGERPGGTPSVKPASPVTSGPGLKSPSVAGADVPRIGRSVQQPTDRAVVPPVGVTIDRLGVSAPIDPVGVVDDGGVEIPEDVRRVGWYRFGADPGAGAGSTVIVGHRDGFDQGRGAFYAIGSLDIGDVVDVELAGGKVRSYEVASREVIDKEILPTSEIFAESGPERLTLISCIGYFDRNDGGYQENVVVTAVPVDDATAEVGP